MSVGTAPSKSPSAPKLRPAPKLKPKLENPPDQPWLIIEEDGIIYPDSDGKPMADNTIQARIMNTVKGNLDLVYQNHPNVFVAENLLWYPVKGKPKIRMAPDNLVVFERPKGDRGSYMQWREENVPIHIVIEILSPKNTLAEMQRKFRFYQRYGVEEYYVYDQPKNTLRVWLRRGRRLVEQKVKEPTYASPRMGVRWDISSGELRGWHPNGDPFLTHEELGRLAAQLKQRASEAERTAVQASLRASELQAENTTLQTENTTLQTENTTLQTQSSEQQARIARLEEMLRMSGIDPTQH